MTEKTSTFEGWAILELMGHRRLVGHLSEQEIGGASFLRLDIPAHGEEPALTQFYAAGAVYCITPTTETVARGVRARMSLRPVERWELLPARTVEPAADEESLYPIDDDVTF